MNDRETNFGAWVTEHNEAIAILYFRFYTDTMQTAIEEDDDEAIHQIMSLDKFVFMLWGEREGGKDLVDLFEKRRQEGKGFTLTDRLLNQRYSDN